MQPDEAVIIDALKTINEPQQLKNLSLNRNTRNKLIQLMQQYIALHVQDFSGLKSLDVLRQILD